MKLSITSCVVIGHVKGNHKLAIAFMTNLKLYNIIDKSSSIIVQYLSHVTDEINFLRIFLDKAYIQYVFSFPRFRLGITFKHT